MVELSARLEAATLSLTGAGTIKDRLLDAYCSHLADVQEGDLPDAMQAQFAEMIEALHRARALPGDDIVKASVRKLSNDEAHRYAMLVVRLYGMLAGTKHYVTNGRAARGMAPLVKFLSETAAASPSRA
ncbi:MAG: hypothetical protein ACHQAR_03835 [Steroidobacterales bacterium]